MITDCLGPVIKQGGGTSFVRALTEWQRGLSVRADGKGQVGKAGAVLLRALADRTDLTSGLSQKMRTKGRQVVHDQGRLLVDLAVVLCLGGKTLSDVRLLGHLAKIFGPSAAPSTLWRALKALDARPVDRISAVRARVRVYVWQQLALRPGGFPWLTVARHRLTGWVVLDMDATLVNTASPKQGAAVTWKKGFGYHPIAVTCDNTTEMLAVHLRPGNAGSNTVADHIAVLAEAVRQVPARLRHKILIRSDGAGGTHGLIDWIRSGGGNKKFTWHYSLGFTVDEDLEKLLAKVPRLAWRAAMNVADRPIGDTWVLELTGRMGLEQWPADMRLIIRRSRIHPRDRKLTDFEKKSGWRYSALVTNTPNSPGRMRSGSKPATAPTRTSRL